MAKKKLPHRDYHPYLIKRLKDPEHAALYIRAHLEHNDEHMPALLMDAIRDVVEAQGMTKFAAQTKLNRQNLYRMLSKDGNPELRSLLKVLDALGMRLTVELKDSGTKIS